MIARGAAMLCLVLACVLPAQAQDAGSADDNAGRAPVVAPVVAPGVVTVTPPPVASVDGLVNAADYAVWETVVEIGRAHV
jgi:hypothetical protein